MTKAIAPLLMAAVAGLLASCVPGAIDLEKAVAITAPPRTTLCSNNLPLDAFHDAWFCSALRKAGEPVVPLSGASATRLAYRLIWLRSFHPAVIVRLEITSSQMALLTAKVVGPGDGTGPDARVIFQQTSPLAPQEIQGVQAEFNVASFWTLPHEFHEDLELGIFSSVIPRDEATISSDGALWLVEGVAEGRYQVIGDNSLDSPPKALGLKLLYLARDKMPDLSIEPVY